LVIRTTLRRYSISRPGRFNRGFFTKIRWIQHNWNYHPYCPVDLTPKRWRLHQLLRLHILNSALPNKRKPGKIICVASIYPLHGRSSSTLELYQQIWSWQPYRWCRMQYFHLTKSLQLQQPSFSLGQIDLLPACQFCQAYQLNILGLTLGLVRKHGQSSLWCAIIATNLPWPQHIWLGCGVLRYRDWSLRWHRLGCSPSPVVHRQVHSCHRKSSRAGRYPSRPLNTIHLPY